MTNNFKSLLTASALFAAVTSCAVIAQAQQTIYEPAPTVVYAQAPTVVYMQAPVVNIGRRHGNLRSAQESIVDAYQRVQQAQQANNGQLGGHAQRAKNLLIQADIELRQAANFANARGR